MKWQSKEDIRKNVIKTYTQKNKTNRKQNFSDTQSDARLLPSDLKNKWQGRYYGCTDKSNSWVTKQVPVKYSALVVSTSGIICVVVVQLQLQLWRNYNVEFNYLKKTKQTKGWKYQCFLFHFRYLLKKLNPVVMNSCLVMYGECM